MIKKNYKIDAFELDNESLKAVDVACRKEGFGNKVKIKERDLKNLP